jgi:hypothetical protein
VGEREKEELVSNKYYEAIHHAVFILSYFFLCLLYKYTPQCFVLKSLPSGGRASSLPVQKQQS